MIIPSLTIDEVFRTARSPYYILTDPYSEHSSGIRVLHSLCHMLNCCGYEAYLLITSTDKGTNDELWTPRLTGDITHAHFLAGRKPIVVYPEAGGDVAVEFGLTVCYLLNRSGFIQGKQVTPGASHIRIAYKQEFAGEGGVAQLLTVPPCDPSIFFPSKLPRGERRGRYFYFNRLLERGGSLLPITEGATEVSPRVPRRLSELAPLLRSAELLYCYEWGAIAAEARMCGCPVVCIPNSQLLPSFEDRTFGEEGMAWGVSEAEIDKAKASVDQYYPRYMGMFDSFRQQFSDFIQMSQKAAQDMSFDACFPASYRAYRGWLPADDAAPPCDASDPAVEGKTGSAVPTVAGLASVLWKGLTGR